jgi:hypothetical protein
MGPSPFRGHFRASNEWWTPAGVIVRSVSALTRAELASALNVHLPVATPDLAVLDA